MTDLERLLALEDIRLLRHRYCRFIDSHQFARLIEVLTPDARLDMTEATRGLGLAGVAVEGIGRIVPLLAGYADGAMFLHLALNPEIEFQSDTAATGIWRQETYLKAAQPTLPGCGIGYATIHDSYRKTPDGWRIASVRVVLDMVV